MTIPLVIALSGSATVLMLPTWGMGLATFLDSERTILTRVDAPDGRLIAQVERIVVGGVPNIVVVVRPSWTPDWYLAGCAAASHYEEAPASVRWTSARTLEIIHASDDPSWRLGSAPFKHRSCGDLGVTLRPNTIP